MNFQKISVITPSYNQGKYLEETILSVLNQGYPNLEYIIIDGGSTDNSIDIIKKYADKLAYWVSEPDDGMYYALQKGFKRSTGEIMGWLNSDDMLHKKSLFSVAEILSLPGVQWLQGFPNIFDEFGRTVQLIDHGRWSQIRHFTDRTCIQQDCTYWRRELWEKAGGFISTEYSVAGDFELWHRFFKYEKLYTPLCLIGGFRVRTEGQLSLDIKRYFSEVDAILKRSEKSADLQKKFRRLEKLYTIKNSLGKTKLSDRLINPGIDSIIRSIHEYPQRITFSRITQKFELDQ